jgi:hypothetical protein
MHRSRSLLIGVALALAFVAVGIALDRSSSEAAVPARLQSAGRMVPLTESFDGPDGLVTNEFAYWNAGLPGIARSPRWQMDSGSLFRSHGVGWSGRVDDAEPTIDSASGTHSAIFRLVSRRADFGDVAVSLRLRVQRLARTASTPPQDWDGVHLFLRYRSERELYYASISRRDGTAVIKKKVPGGPSNGGTYTTISPVARLPVALGRWQAVRATVATLPDGSVNIRLLQNGRLVVQATDRGQGGPPILGAGRIGLRGDNTEFAIDDVVAEPLPARGR